MPKVKAKLSKGEIVLNPATTQQYRKRLEEMNKEGMIARNMGGVAAYRANGGAVSYNADGGEPVVKPTFMEQVKANPGAIDNLGASLVSIGQRDFKGASEALSRRPEVDKSAVKRGEQDAKNLEGIQTLGKLSAKAYGLVDLAGTAIVAKHQIAASWNDWYRVQAQIPYVNQGVEALKHSMDEGIAQDFREWTDGNPEEGKSFAILERVVTTLTTTALDALGPGPKTDFDFIVAGRTVANLEGRPTQIKATLKDAVDVANEKLVALGETPIELVETPDVAVSIDADLGVSISTPDGDGDEEASSLLPDALEAGQKFTSEGATGISNYDTFEKDSKAWVRVTDTLSTGGEYELFYDKYTKTWYIEGSTGKTTLTPTISEPTEVASNGTSGNNNGLIAI